MSTRPMCFNTASRNKSIDFRSCTLAGWTSVLRPIFLISSQALSTRSFLRPLGTTFAPCCASPIAIARPNPEVAPTTTATRPLRSNRFMLVGNFHASVILRIRPPVVGNRRSPSRTARILIVWIVAEALVQFAIFTELFTIEPYAQPRTLGHADRAVLILHESALDHVVHQMMIVRVRGE